MTELPADMQEIRDAEDERPRRQWPFARHKIRYTYGRDHAERVIADFAVEGPLPIPAKGQVIELHGVYVTVAEVLISYYAAADGTPCVTATIRVESADPRPPTPAPSDPGSGEVRRHG